MHVVNHWGSGALFLGLIDVERAEGLAQSVRCPLAPLCIRRARCLEIAASYYGVHRIWLEGLFVGTAGAEISRFEVPLGYAYHVATFDVLQGPRCVWSYRGWSGSGVCGEACLRGCGDA